jgi:hypothetical protein
MPQELQAVARRLVRTVGGSREDDLRAEGRVQCVRTEGAGVQRAGDELPERVEVGERRLSGS